MEDNLQKNDTQFSLNGIIKELDSAFIFGKRQDLYKLVVQSIEKPLIEKVLERTFGNQIKAAKILGINRNTLRSKIFKLGIDVNKWKI